MSTLVYIAVALAAAAVLLAFWMVVVEQRRFRVRRVVLDAGAQGLPELKILHLTDTHFHGRDGHILAYLADLARREQFDLVLMTGDLIDRAPGVESAVRAASLFEPRIGAFAVLGGHDYMAIGPVATYIHLLSNRRLDQITGRNPVEALAAGLEAAGVRVLADEHVLLRTAEGRAFGLIGLRDLYEFSVDYEGAWRGLPPNTPTVLIAHSPDVLPEVTRRGARLAFFGHTHGGQVRLPLVGALVTRCSLPGRLAHGAFRSGPTVFILNNGLGTAPPTSFRLLCPPEVTVAELTQPADANELTPIPEAGLD